MRAAQIESRPNRVRYHGTPAARKISVGPSGSTICNWDRSARLSSTHRRSLSSERPRPRGRHRQRCPPAGASTAARDGSSPSSTVNCKVTDLARSDRDVPPDAPVGRVYAGRAGGKPRLSPSTARAPPTPARRRRPRLAGRPAGAQPSRVAMAARSHAKVTSSVKVPGRRREGLDREALDHPRLAQSAPPDEHEGRAITLRPAAARCRSRLLAPPQSS